MRILILGSGSFAGQALFSNFLENGLDVFGINRSPLKQNHHWEWINKYPKESLNWFELNLNENSEELSRLIKEINPSHIVDFMGQGMVAPSWKNPKLWYSTNISEKSLILDAFTRFAQIGSAISIICSSVFSRIFIN